LSKKNIFISFSLYLSVQFVLPYLEPLCQMKEVQVGIFLSIV